MSEPQIISINDKNYYLSDDIRALHESFFKNCGNSVRQIVIRHNISDRHVFYAKKEDDEWVSTPKNNKKTGKLLLSKSWVEKNVPGFGDVVEEDIIANAPALIVLEDSETFTNGDGDVVDVEVRGTRNVNKSFFKLKDISSGFNMPNLHSTVINTQHDGYREKEHYIYFKCKNPGSNTRRKTLFLTYTGLMRVLYASTSKGAKQFISWANKIIYTAHMGTKEQKEKVVAEMIGVSLKLIRELFNNSSDNVQVLYKFNIGTVEELREIYNIPMTYDDNMIVSKVGRTKNIIKRTEQHTTAFKKDGIEIIHLAYINYVHPHNIVKAESQLLQLMASNGYKLDVPHHNELIIHSKVASKKIKKIFADVAKSFPCGDTDSEKIVKMESAMAIQKMVVEHTNEISGLKLAFADLKMENIVFSNRIRELVTENESLKKKLIKSKS